MKISIRYSISFIIFLLVTVFVILQTLFNRDENISVIDTLSETINPFWRAPDIGNQKFEEILKIPVTHQWTWELLVSGKIKIFDENNNQLKDIAKITDNNADILVDYLPINSEKKSIESWKTETFEVHWHWIWDKFIDIESWEPKIIFNSPIIDSENISVPDIYFWEKPLIKYKDYKFILKTDISSINTVTNEVIEQNLDDKNITIKYKEFDKTTNTGFVIILSLFIALVLILSKILSEKNDIQKQEKQKIKNIEKFAQESIQIVQEIRKKEKYNKHKKTK